jgi:hypothetical protein
MKIQSPPILEKRQFSRVNISEPKTCQVHVSQTHRLWQSRGIIQNISLGGVYFACDRQPPLEKNDIRYLTFDTVYNDQKLYRLKFHVQVVRTEEEWRPELSKYAVAIKFLSDPVYFPFQEIDPTEFPELDKTRIMYQYYRLNRKAYEIVQATPEIRSERINNLKERIDHDLYRVKSDDLAQRFTSNLLQENILISKK